MSKKNPTPNDARSNAKNPNNPAHKYAQDNRSRQLNPKDTKTRKEGPNPGRRK